MCFGVLRRTMGKNLSIAAFLLAVLAIVAPTPSRTQGPSTEGLASFAGVYVLGSDARELHGMEQAIDHVVDQLNIFIREIARGEIHRRIDPEQRIHLTLLGGDSIAISLDDWGPIEVPVNGPARRVRDATGENVRLTVRYAGGRLIQHSAAPRGARTNVYALSGDASRLSMSVRITSDQLPDDIRYRLTYRRAD